MDFRFNEVMKTLGLAPTATSGIISIIYYYSHHSGTNSMTTSNDNDEELGRVETNESGIAMGMDGAPSPVKGRDSVGERENIVGKAVVVYLFNYFILNLLLFMNYYFLY